MMLLSPLCPPAEPFGRTRRRPTGRLTSSETTSTRSGEVSLPVGRLRVRPKGSAGGHNGLKSIISALGSDGFPRVRIGVGAPPHPDYDMADWVLGVFRDADAEAMAAAAKRAAEAVECYITEGPERAMNRFNAKA